METENVETSRSIINRKMRPPTPPRWVSYYHVIYTLIFCVTGIIVPTMYMHNLQFTDLLMIPTTFVGANLLEYVVHRWPMHNKYPGADFMLKLHMIHHNYFYEDTYRIEAFDDYGMIVFPPIVLNIIAFVATPLFAAIAWWLGGENMGLLVFATVMGYYLLMQLIHVLTHFNDSHWVVSIPGIRHLWIHHKVHHCKRNMSKVNFNFIIPLTDWIVGTSSQNQN